MATKAINNMGATHRASAPCATGWSACATRDSFALSSSCSARWLPATWGVLGAVARPSAEGAGRHRLRNARTSPRCASIASAAPSPAASSVWERPSLCQRCVCDRQRGAVGCVGRVPGPARRPSELVSSLAVPHRASRPADPPRPLTASLRGSTALGRVPEVRPEGMVERWAQQIRSWYARGPKYAAAQRLAGDDGWVGRGRSEHSSEARCGVQRRPRRGRPVVMGRLPMLLACACAVGSGQGFVRPASGDGDLIGGVRYVPPFAAGGRRRVLLQLRWQKAEPTGKGAANPWVGWCSSLPVQRMRQSAGRSVRPPRRPAGPSPPVGACVRMGALGRALAFLGQRLEGGTRAAQCKGESGGQASFGPMRTPHVRP